MQKKEIKLSDDNTNIIYFRSIRSNQNFRRNHAEREKTEHRNSQVSISHFESNSYGIRQCSSADSYYVDRGQNSSVP